MWFYSYRMQKGDGYFGCYYGRSDEHPIDKFVRWNNNQQQYGVCVLLYWRWLGDGPEPKPIADELDVM